MFALNGSIAAYLLPPEGGVGAVRLSQLRSVGSWLILLLALGLLRRDLLRVDRRELPGLALLGVVGLAGVHATYFLAIERLPIGVAVTIQYTAPMLLLIWLRVAHGRRVARSLCGGRWRCPPRAASSWCAPTTRARWTAWGCWPRSAPPSRS